jgi:chemotaxis protein histidine kinase CheA
VEGVGGATILGNGRVALILDIAGLHGTAQGSCQTAGETRIPASGSIAMALQ